ncbi:hypothetical protein ABF87_09900 [Nitrosomonas sp. JL21]|nr:hypothetical protein [Nitrosomonas sp. JL21]
MEWQSQAALYPEAGFFCMLVREALLNWANEMKQSIAERGNGHINRIGDGGGATPKIAPGILIHRR